MSYTINRRRRGLFECITNHCSKNLFTTQLGGSLGSWYDEDRM